MLELKEIVSHLKETSFESLKNDFTKTNADNFLYLLTAYRCHDDSDDTIIKYLQINKNAFYVLKSRLHEKIQEHLTKHIEVEKEEILKQLLEISNICYNTPRVLANSILEKLEKKLLKYDMHFELQLVYSALKKNHLFSENYFYYSQLYNKQVALGFSLEKVEELLGKFNLLLSQYFFSKKAHFEEQLLFLIKEINNHNQLNASRQITIIKNISSIQLLIFCDTELQKEHSAIELLQETEKIIHELPLTPNNTKWKTVINYLYFEYYYKTGQLKLAREYYAVTDALKENLLLYNGLCCCRQFFITKISFLQSLGELTELYKEPFISIYYDNADFFSKVIVKIHESIVMYYKKNFTEAIFILNNLCNTYYFKDCLHIEIEIKLLLASLHMQQKNEKESHLILNNLKRKIRVHGLENEYEHVFLLIKSMLSGDYKNNIKTKYTLDLFISQNTNHYKISTYLIPIFKNI